MACNEMPSNEFWHYEWFLNGKSVCNQCHSNPVEQHEKMSYSIIMWCQAAATSINHSVCSMEFSMHSASTHTQNDVLQPALKCVLLTLLSFNPDWRWFHTVHIDKYTCKSLVRVTGGILPVVMCTCNVRLTILLTYLYIHSAVQTRWTCFRIQWRRWLTDH